MSRLVIGIAGIVAALAQHPAAAETPRQPSAIPAFPVIAWEPGERVPNFRLPTLVPGRPGTPERNFHDLLGGEPTILHIFASW